MGEGGSEGGCDITRKIEKERDRAENEEKGSAQRIVLEDNINTQTDTLCNKKQKVPSKVATNT